MLKNSAQRMINEIIAENMPETAVKKALEGHNFYDKKVFIVAIGKAAWTMAKAASDVLGAKIETGIVITKYNHSLGEINNLEIFEAGHPVIDENSIIATEKAIQLVGSLGEDSEVLFLISGGGSSLFESPPAGITLQDVSSLTHNLLASGADIVEMNVIRKRLSKVKAGRFARMCFPAKVFAIVLSDVIGDRLDTIASGPAAVDKSTCEDALKVINKYQLELTDIQRKFLELETPKELNNVKTVITGSVRSLCESAASSAKRLGFTPYIVTTTLTCEASQAGSFLSSIAFDTVSDNNCFRRPCAIIAGGETVVTLRGKGVGGRNQELALSAASGISGLNDVLIFSLGSDGTDGPTDAAGGMVDGESLNQLKDIGLDIDEIIKNNDSYNGLKAINGLIITGPTGTNVNDVAVILCQ